MNIQLPPEDLALVEQYEDMRSLRAQGWRSLILAGYLPFWSWRFREFTWAPTDALLAQGDQS